MHDNATHNSNATHDDAKMMMILTMKVMLMVMMNKSFYVLFTTVSTKPGGFFSGKQGINRR